MELSAVITDITINETKNEKFRFKTHIGTSKRLYYKIIILLFYTRNLEKDVA